MKRTVIGIGLLVLACGAGLAAGPSMLLRAERKADNDLAVLRAADLPVVKEMGSCLFLQGDEQDLTWLKDHGYAVSVLDFEPEQWDYFVIGLRPDSDQDAVFKLGAVLLSEDNWVLVRAARDVCRDSLYAARVFVSRMPHEPVSAPKEGPSLAPAVGGSGAAATAADPLVQKMVNTVNTTQIDQFWTDLTVNSPTGTRYSSSQGCADAGTYCYNKYATYKLPAQYQNWSTTYKPNVIATQQGVINPGNVFIVIGHLDDMPSSGLAPGADDNGSGSVVVLESARVMSCYAFKNTIKYINCTGEEEGLLGSDAYAADAQSRGENILGVINMDMPGWQGDGIPSTGENLDLDYNAASQDLGQRFAAAATTYGTGLPVDAFLCPSLDASDHYSFWTRGWKAVCGITDNEGYCGHGGNYPYYHTSNDTLANCGNRSFFYSVVRASVATLAELGEPFKITFDKPTYACNAASHPLYLGDRDLNTNPNVVETVTVSVSSTAEPTPETFTLTEQNANSMIFAGSIPTTTGPPVHGDGLLSIFAAGDTTITATYTDALDCNGATSVSYQATTQIDCAAPVISNVQAMDVRGTTATITWTTNEAATSVVHYGTTPPGSSTTSSAALVTAHSVGLTGLSTCTTYYYWVESADALGNNASDNNGGVYYTFTTGQNTILSYSNNTPVSIPDNNTTGATSTINVSDNNTVQDVNVTVNITHTYDGDLALYLITPTGAQITLSNKRGGAGDNFTSTVFDDEATTPISAGAAPFTGAFTPDSPLSAADGINAAGAWKLKAVDSKIGDTGTIVNWTLTLTYPAAQCGPHAKYDSHAAVQDTCSTGGTGDHDSIWDDGEDVQFSVTIQNDGASTLTGVTATVTSITPGVVMLRGAASYPDLAPNSSGTSLAPHFTARLPRSLACGSNIGFQLTIASDQGTWPGSFSHPVGQVVTGGAPVNENFAAGIPASWTVVDGGSGGGAAATWTTVNPCSRSFASPLAAPAAIVDSNCAGAGAVQNEQLITPAVNLSTALAVTLEFDQYFRYYNAGRAEIADVDVRSSLTGGAWVNVLSQQASSPNPDHQTINITSRAAGATNVQVRFHYYNASYEWYWEVDNVKVSYTQTPECRMTVCAAPGPPPVPDGRFGSPVTATRETLDGSSISIHWDVATCTAADYHLLYGPLASVSTYTISGSECDLGTSGVHLWTGVPTSSLWYVVVADDNSSTEGTWGTNSAGAHRGGTTPSNRCGLSSRDNSGACP